MPKAVKPSKTCAKPLKSWPIPSLGGQLSQAEVADAACANHSEPQAML